MRALGFAVNACFAEPDDASKSFENVGVRVCREANQLDPQACGQFSLRINECSCLHVCERIVQEQWPAPATLGLYLRAHAHMAHEHVEERCDYSPLAARLFHGIHRLVLEIAFARLEGNLGRHIQSLPLSEDSLAAALPKDHPLAAKESISLQALADETLVMASRDVSPVYFDYLVGQCKASGFAPRIVHQVRSVSSQVAFVSCGQGIALVPTSMGKLAPENVLIRPLHPEVKVVITAMAWHNEHKNPLVEAMIDHAKDLLS